MVDRPTAITSRESLTRRGFLGATGAGATAVLLGTGAFGATEATAAPVKGSLFTLGVASGDPLPDGVVLWTRLARDPLAPDGRGGMPDRKIPVRYQVAEDEKFSRVVRAGVAIATPELGHSVHPEVNGLRPDREYFYRFQAGSDLSPIGRTRTSPAPDADISQLRFAFASCQSYEAGHYTSYQHMAEDDLDLVVHLGDYIYEDSYVAEPEFHGGGALPDYLQTECLDLPRYRLQYALYKLDHHLQAAHARFPWIHTFDDHEVDNGWKGGIPDLGPSDFERRAAAFQAMYENMPLRRTQMPTGPDIRIHRRISYGQLADFTMLDSHQFREKAYEPDNTNLGQDQLDWLIAGFSSSTARWQLIGNQQPMAETDRDPDPDTKQFFGAWDAYAAEREKVLTEARSREVDNLVVITGDRHSNYVMDLKTDYSDPDSDVVGTEFVGTSISSGKDGADMLPVGEDYLEANPHMKFCNFQRGYCRVTVTPDTLTNDFQVVPYVSEPDAEIHTRASFVVEHGRPGAEPA